MNKDMGLQSLNNSIELLEDYLKKKNISCIELFDPRQKSKYFLSFGLILILISGILYLLGIKIFVPKIMKYIFLGIGLLVIGIGLIILLGAKLKRAIPYLDLKNVFKKLTFFPNKQRANLTKKLIINNTQIAYLDQCLDEEIKEKETKFYKLLDTVYSNHNDVMKSFILEDLQKNRMNLN